MDRSNVRRTLAAALLPLAVSAGTAGAQQTARGAGGLSVGLYAGAAASTSWFVTNADGERSWGTGVSPVVGLTSTYWATPNVGVRGHFSYSQVPLPRNEDTKPDVDVNRFLYDVGVAYRPLATAASPAAASTYVFAGIGGATTNVNGLNQIDCMPVAGYLVRGVCVHTKKETNLAWNAGVGIDAARLGPTLSAFAELGVHGAGAPVEVCEEGSCPGGGSPERKHVLIPRLGVGLRVHVR